MALPKLRVPEFPLTFPLSNKKITFRPYTVGDEKLLLAAASARASDPEFFVNNTFKVIRNCISSPELLDTLPSVDVEFLLLQIRSKAVGEIVDVAYKDENGVSHRGVVNLEEFYVVHNPDHKYDITLSESPLVGIKMKDLSFVQRMKYSAKFDNSNSKTDAIFETIIDCVESIYDDDKVYVVGVDCTRAEVQQFIEGISGQSAQLYNFIATMPQLETKITLQDGSKKAVNSSQVDFLALSQTT